MSLDYQAYNQAVQNWGTANRTRLQATGRGMSILHRQNSSSKGDSLGKIKDRYGYDRSGVINRVTFGSINRSLIYTAQGAGKGMGGSKGSRWIDRQGNNKKTDPKSLGKLGSGSRTSKPFINRTLESNEGVEALADIVATHQADAIIESVYLK